jgi:hypothetical protein
LILSAAKLSVVYSPLEVSMQGFWLNTPDQI